MKNAGICCLLLVVCCLLSVVFCLLSGVWCLLSVVCCSLSVVWCLLCVSRGRQVYTNVDEAFHIERASRSLAKTGFFLRYFSALFLDLFLGTSFCRHGSNFMPFWSPKWSKILQKKCIFGKVPTCVWIEPARSDCVSGLSRSLPKSRKTC